MIYVDSNIFIHAFIDKGAVGEKARKFLQLIQEGREKAATSALTYDEVVWKVWKSRSYEDALSAANDLIEFPNLVLIGVDDKIVAKSFDLMKIYRIFPRDSLHAACALENGIFIFLSQDKGFDKIKELKRKTL